MEVGYKELLEYAEAENLCDYDTAIKALGAIYFLDLYDGKVEYLVSLIDEARYYTSPLCILGFKIVIGFMTDNGLQKCKFVE